MSLENDYTKVETMSPEEIAKEAESFKEPRFPYVLFVYKTLNKIQNVTNIFNFVLPLDGSHSRDNVEQYLDKGYHVAKYQLPKIASNRDDRIIELEKFLMLLDKIKEGYKPAKKEAPIVEATKKVKELLESKK